MKGDKEMQKMKMATASNTPKKNFKINDDDMSCLGDTLDPLGLCITMGETRDGTLINRLLLCGFAIVLLWASSFQTAVYIANSAISSPLFESVQDSCQSSYDLVQSEDSDYVDCVDRQMDDCDEAFEEKVLNVEVASTNEILTENAEILKEVATYQQSCSDAFTKGQSAISKWVTTDIDYRVSYTCESNQDDDGPSTNAYCNASCTYEEASNVLAAQQNGESIRKYQSCSCSEVADMVGDISALRAAAFSTATEYSEYSQSTVGSLVDYSLARSKYDEIYAYNKTEPLRIAMLTAMANINSAYELDMNFTFPGLSIDTDISMSCASMRDQVNFTACAIENLEDLRSLYDSVREQFESQLSTAVEGVSQYSDEASMLIDRVQDSYDQFMVFYDGVFGDIDDLDIETDDGLGWFNMEVSDFITADPSWPSTVGVLSDVANVKGADYIYGATADSLENFVNALAAASSATSLAGILMGSAMYDVVQNLNALGFEDYDPPTYDQYAPEDSESDDQAGVEAEHEAESGTYVEEQASSLNAFSELNGYIADDASLSEYNLSFSSTDDFTFSSVDFAFEGFTPNTIDWDLVTVGIARIMNLLLALDFMYRFFKTLYYIRKFWSRAGLAMPDVDIRQDKYELDLSCGGGAAGSTNGGGGCIACILCPCWAPCLCLFFVVIILINVIVLYIPIVNEYSDVCVKGNGNHTFLTGNLYSIALNYAAEAGNEDLIDGTENYNVRLADYCGAYTTFSQEQQAEDELLLSELQTSHDFTRNDLQLINECVNTTVMDQYFNLACCGDGGGYEACEEYASYGNVDDNGWLKGADNKTCPVDSNNNPYPLLSTLLDPYSENTAAADCLEDPSEWSLDDASFYCTSLPTCDITCDGPNKALLKVATEQCGCMVEWMMHTWWAQVAGALVVYVIMNISREILLSGITRLCW
eukprot:CAMPEP_0114381324 /NCGR_PEP_ID=MMETSP0102-20121206/3382_1 /TAXON_ID=38822 ORGANISM="Pteridomonas danica, Strain PT" /NCGR_SAMPLE_ID=MMETSP0102 /ASSEMBLY_ACC=CAM_ASM_000212 /LENGTH=931 /DNA_ID=CAMNT_0001536785 /DNA_START=60 /DNA_END=2852 /DNA_ORIENTATION=+